MANDLSLQQRSEKLLVSALVSNQLYYVASLTCLSAMKSNNKKMFESFPLIIKKKKIKHKKHNAPSMSGSSNDSDSCVFCYTFLPSSPSASANLEKSQLSVVSSHVMPQLKHPKRQGQLCGHHITFLMLLLVLRPHPLRSVLMISESGYSLFVKHWF